MTFWILLAIKCPLESISKPYGRGTAMSTAWGLKIITRNHAADQEIEFSQNRLQGRMAAQTPCRQRGT